MHELSRQVFQGPTRKLQGPGVPILFDDIDNGEGAFSHDIDAVSPMQYQEYIDSSQDDPDPIHNSIDGLQKEVKEGEGKGDVVRHVHAFPELVAQMKGLVKGSNRCCEEYDDQGC